MTVDSSRVPAMVPAGAGEAVRPGAIAGGAAGAAAVVEVALVDPSGFFGNSVTACFGGAGGANIFVRYGVAKITPNTRTNAMSILACMGNSRFSLFMGNGVHSPGRERMAAAEAFNTQPHAAARTETFYRFPHVHRAGGMKPAGRRQKRRNSGLVEAQQGY